VNDRSALTDELNLEEVHPELNSGFSPRPSVRVLSTEIFPKMSVTSTRMHLWFSNGLPSNVHTFPVLY